MDEDTLGTPGQEIGDAVSRDTEQAAGEGDAGDVNEEMVRKRAREIAEGEEAASPEENRDRAEREVEIEEAGP